MTRLMIQKTYDITPHMEYFFDEITEKLMIRCPTANKLVYVEALRSAHNRHTPFVGIVKCEGCGQVILEEEEHLNRINKIYYHH